MLIIKEKKNYAMDGYNVVIIAYIEYASYVLVTVQ